MRYNLDIPKIVRSPLLPFLFLAIGASALRPVVLINAGSTVSFVDNNGNVWRPDTNTDGRMRSTDLSAQIADTQNDGLYRQFRDKLNAQGSLYYNITVPNGTYTVELHFADLLRKRAGQRLFDVLFEGILVLDNYDPIENAGSRFDVDVQTIDNVVVNDGELNIEFRQGRSHVMVSAIGVYTYDSSVGPIPPVVVSDLLLESDGVSDAPSDTPSDAPSFVPSAWKVSDIESSLPTIPQDFTNVPATSFTRDVDYDIFQPRVIEVEANPPQKAQGFIGFPRGSPWCQGRPTYWWTGHDNRPEEPFCEEADGTWNKSSTAQLNIQDDLNVVDGPANIDRHDCVAFDANFDGIEDIICVVGANRGTGAGFTEVYYTRSDGKIERELNDVGLYKYPSMRTRHVEKLTSSDGSDMIVIATTGGHRDDGLTNAHRMFQLTAAKFFVEVMGPFNLEFHASFLLVSDLNHDGIDDIVIGSQFGFSHGFVQNKDGTWSELNWDDLDPRYLSGWNGARVADVTGDGVPDLLAVGPYQPWRAKNPDPYLRVYRGNPDLPSLFDFQSPVVDKTLPFQAMDVEVLDVNEDGLLDIYVVQWNMTPGVGDYCQQTFRWRDWWQEGHDSPPTNFVPPNDTAPDFLYLSIDGANWDVAVMEHAIPGCGHRVQKWQDKALAVAHGHLSRPGFNVILDWS